MLFAKLTTIEARIEQLEQNTEKIAANVEQSRSFQQETWELSKEHKVRLKVRLLPGSSKHDIQTNFNYAVRKQFFTGHRRDFQALAKDTEVFLIGFSNGLYSSVNLSNTFANLQLRHSSR